MTLQESLRTALERNNKTQANDLRAEAMQERAKAAWMRMFPELTVSGYQSKDRSNDGINPPTTSRTSGISYQISANLFNGGADYYNAKAAEAAAKATEARYKSTNAFIPNTKGALSQNVTTAYIHLVDAVAQRNYLTQAKTYLEKVLSAATNADDINILKDRIANVDTDLIQNNFDIQSAQRDFQYYVTLPAPPVLDSYEKIISSLVIPPTADEALTTALEKSPDVAATEYDLQSSRFRYRAQVGNSYLPRIDVYARKTRDNSNVVTDPFNSSTRGTSVGINASWTFSAGSFAENRAEAKQVEAATKERDGSLDELKYSIESSYPLLKVQEQLYQEYSKNLELSNQGMQNMVAKIDAGQKINIQNARDLLGSQSNNWYMLTQTRKNLINIKFGIQRTIGSLFESVGLSPMGEPITR